MRKNGRVGCIIISRMFFCMPNYLTVRSYLVSDDETPSIGNTIEVVLVDELIPYCCHIAYRLFLFTSKNASHDCALP